MSENENTSRSYGAGAAGEIQSSQVTKPTTRQKLRYRFDNSMSKGTPALIGWLAVVSFVMLTIYSLIVFVGSLTPHDNLTDYGPLNAFWTGLMLSLDAGTLGEEFGLAGKIEPHLVHGAFADRAGDNPLPASGGEVLGGGFQRVECLSCRCGC